MSETTIAAGTVTGRARNLVDLPAVRQGLLLVGIAASVAVGIATVIWSRSPDYSLLYANLADRDAGAVVNALQASAIPYELESTSGAIMVPAERVHEARLKLAADGLPQGSGMGFELIGDEKGFGVSQFMEGARYQHILETELTRTIASLRPVQSARVHLALPKQSVFVRDRRPASASVMLELYPGRQLEQPQVAAIIHLVAASIPDLEAGGVTVVDQQGRLLTESHDATDLALTSAQFDYKTRVEESYARRIVDLVTPLVGAERVHAQVTAEMDFTVTEQTLETYNPDTAALRSEQRSDQIQLADTLLPAGVPGALSNQPASASTPPVEGDMRNNSSTATRNFELDRTVSHVRQPTGAIRRLSVAVIVDEPQTVAEDGTVSSTPLSADELQRMTTLVRDAVGYDAARGDSVNVINAPFVAPDAIEPVAVDWWEQPLLQQGIRQIVGLVLVLGLIFGLLRPSVKHLLAKAPEATLALPYETSNANPPPQPALTFEQRMQAARTLVNEDPKRAAQVVRDWVAEDG